MTQFENHPLLDDVEDIDCESTSFLKIWLDAFGESNVSIEFDGLELYILLIRLLCLVGVRTARSFFLGVLALFVTLGLAGQRI